MATTSMRVVLLALLAMQNCAMAFLLSARPKTKDSYSPASAIFISEVMKVISSSILVVYSSRRRDADPFHSKMSPLRYLWSRCADSSAWRIAIVAAMFVVQGNLKLLSAPLLTPTTLQILQESRLLFVIGASIVVLRTKVTKPQWLAACLMILAVVAMQSPTVQGPNRESRPEAGLSSATQDDITFARRLGTLGMLTVGLIGAFASVLIEKAMRTVDVWVINSQLSCFSLLPALVPVLVHGHIADIFHGFGLLAWMTVFNLAFGGILVALVIKECGNIAKTFTTPLSIVPSFAISTVFMGTPFSWSIASSATLAIAAVVLYNHYKPGPDTPSPTIGDDEEKGLLKNSERSVAVCSTAEDEREEHRDERP